MNDPAIHVHNRGRALLPVPAAAVTDPGYISTKEQRGKRTALCALLRDDLYQRVGGQTASAYWESPLGWGVEYGPNRDGTTNWCRVYQPDGTLYAENLLATDHWLDSVLP